MNHVALYLPSLRGGGAERVMVTLAQGFAERGFRVDLVLAHAEGPYLGEVPSTVRVVDLGSSGVLASLPRLVRYLREERPEALLSTLDHANLVVLWARRIARVPLRVIVRAAINVGVNSDNSVDPKDRVILRLVQCFYRWADAVVAVSQGVADDLVRVTGIPRGKVHVIYNPAVTAEIFRKSKQPLDHPWFAPGEPPVVLAVGRLAAQKDYPTLIRAFALVRGERSARLLILGEGQQRPHLEQLVHELGVGTDVCLAGFEDNPYRHMARAAVFVLSSRWEGLPNALIEALALGTPVISTDCPSGPAEILHGGDYGALVPVGDSAGLARAILQSIGDQAAVVPPHAVARFRPEIVCNLYVNLLAHLGN